MRFIEPGFEIISDDFKRDVVLSRIERAARTCYKSEDKIKEGSAEKPVQSLIKRSHEAMLEHAPNLSVRFICDRGVSHELVRHRLFSFAQESTRYVNYSNKGMQFIIPIWITGEDRECMLKGKFDYFVDLDKLLKDDCNKILTTSCINSEELYNNLIENGWKPQQARAVLPNCIKTEIVVTGNIREWRNFFKLRLDNAAHPQMRELIIPLFKKLHTEIPEIWDDIAIKFDIE